VQFGFPSDVVSHDAVTRELSGSTQEEKYNLRVKVDASEQNVRVGE
jgi:hypothetical protein